MQKLTNEEGGDVKRARTCGVKKQEIVEKRTQSLYKTYTSLFGVCVLSSSDSSAIHLAGIRPCTNHTVKSQHHKRLICVCMCIKMYVAHRSDFSVVVFLGEVSGQAKVSDLEQKTFSNQHISSSQVAVHTLWRNKQQ